MIYCKIHVKAITNGRLEWIKFTGCYNNRNDLYRLGSEELTDETANEFLNSLSGRLSLDLFPMFVLTPDPVFRFNVSNFKVYDWGHFINSEFRQIGILVTDCLPVRFTEKEIELNWLEDGF